MCELEMCLGDDVSGSVCVYTVYTRYVLVFKVCMCARERVCAGKSVPGKSVGVCWRARTTHPTVYGMTAANLDTRQHLVE